MVVFACQILSAQTFVKTKTHKKFTGYFNFYYNEANDEVHLEVSKLDEEFLYQTALAAGVGSNDIGLDRGQLGSTAVVKFVKAGNKLLLIQPNLKFRAISNNPEEAKSVSEAFAQSVIYGFPIVEQKYGRYLIDITKFIARDAHGVANRLQSRRQGSYSLDPSRSAMFMERTKAFPKNVEFEAILTFKGKASGSYITSVAPNSQFITVRQHHSFVELPDANYQKRKFDPRSGSFAISYMDYATPITSDIEKKYIVRHRLEKKNPGAFQSEPVEPIIYYLDRGAPEPVKSALLEGGSWWNQAFEAAGYKDAFQIRVLPEGADPLDERYNVVQWVHRSTRGWSYGGSVVDPRTGEIIKGHVSLGSLRVRQDYLIAQSLVGVSNRSDAQNEALQMALARIRQLSAHEIGHTLGFTHNFAASTNLRASVMDYPHPYVQLKNGEIDLSEAYDDRIGAWDKVSVMYAYQDFPTGTNEEMALEAILEDSFERGLKFISDSDARAPGGAHVDAHLWDNGLDAGKELERVLQVREVAISNFSENNIEDGKTYSHLEDAFVPLYFFHRYQTEAAAKMIGGSDYSYAVKNDGQNVVSPVNPEKERFALTQILETLSVDHLKIPEGLLRKFPPRAYGYGRTRESFKTTNGMTFDALGAAQTASEFTLKYLFHYQRANRLIQQKALFSNNVGLEELIRETIKVTFLEKHNNAYEAEIQNSINIQVLEALLTLGAHKGASFQVKAIVRAELIDLKEWADTNNTAYIKELSERIGSYLKDNSDYVTSSAPKIPDGSPIGSEIRCDFN